ncbi:hypothetical protein GCM10010149_88490 [Nonomuraea roseoviolacea subsp. roseoviolacea]|uniref:hypothetical protein n=1 Tax=Nonomuraea roseoviolacea TaxID=103837 RepID=UPI0031D8A177
MHYHSGNVFELISEEKRQAFKASGGPYTVEHVIELAEGDTSDAAGTTKKVFAGPGKVRYLFYRDGGVETYPSDGARLTHLQRSQRVNVKVAFEISDDEFHALFDSRSFREDASYTGPSGAKYHASYWFKENSSIERRAAQQYLAANGYGSEVHLVAGYGRWELFTNYYDHTR